MPVLPQGIYKEGSSMRKQARFFSQLVNGHYMVIDRSGQSAITNDSFQGIDCETAGDASLVAQELNKREDVIADLLEAAEMVIRRLQEPWVVKIWDDARQLGMLGPLYAELQSAIAKVKE